MGRDRERFIDWTVDVFESWCNKVKKDIVTNSNVEKFWLLYFHEIFKSFAEKSPYEGGRILYGLNCTCNFYIDYYTNFVIYNPQIGYSAQGLSEKSDKFFQNFDNESENVKKEYKNLVNIANLYTTFKTIIELRLRSFMIDFIITDMNSVPYFELDETDKEYLYKSLLKISSYYSSQLVTNKTIENLISKAYKAGTANIVDSGISGAFAGGILFGPLGMIAGAALGSLKAKNDKKLF